MTRYLGTQPLLRLGSHGPFVQELQRLLNLRLRPAPHLVVDGHFTPGVHNAVRRFQRESWLHVDGCVGDATWAALREMERWVILDSSVRLVVQPTATTCWAASTAMLLGRAQPVTAPAGMLAADGGLLNDGEMNDAANSRRYAAMYGLQLLPPQTYTPDALAALLRAHGRLMMNTLWDARSYARTGAPAGLPPGVSAGSPGHVRVIAGIRGDGTGEGTTLRIYDPWPPPSMGGSTDDHVYSVTYGPFIRETPASTYQIYHR